MHEDILHNLFAFIHRISFQRHTAQNMRACLPKRAFASQDDWQHVRGGNGGKCHFFSTRPCPVANGDACSYVARYGVQERDADA